MRWTRLLALSLLAGCSPQNGGSDRSEANVEAGGHAASAAAPADLVLTNARVYTLDPARPWAEALAIADGRILAVGDARSITAGYAGETLDLQGGIPRCPFPSHRRRRADAAM